MDCCCSRKPSSRDHDPSLPLQRRGVPSSSATPNKSNLAGVGIVFSTVGHNNISGLVVASLAVDGPADKSGQVKAGDVLVSIDRVDVRGISAEDLAPYILGSPGSKVIMGFERPGQNTRYVELIRGWTMKRNITDEQWSNPLPPNHSLLPGIGPQ
jgi:C-terminal processing protease CtpA/Prc